MATSSENYGDPESASKTQLAGKTQSASKLQSAGSETTQPEVELVSYNGLCFDGNSPVSCVYWPTIVRSPFNSGRCHYRATRGAHKYQQCTRPASSDDSDFNIYCRIHQKNVINKVRLAKLKLMFDGNLQTYLDECYKRAEQGAKSEGTKSEGTKSEGAKSEDEPINFERESTCKGFEYKDFAVAFDNKLFVPITKEDRSGILGTIDIKTGNITPLSTEERKCWSNKCMIIEHTATNVSELNPDGSMKSTNKSESEAELKVEPKSESKVEPEPKSESEAELKVEPEPKSESKTETKTKTKATTKTETKVKIVKKEKGTLKYFEAFLAKGLPTRKFPWDKHITKWRATRDELISYREKCVMKNNAYLIHDFLAEKDILEALNHTTKLDALLVQCNNVLEELHRRKEHEFTSNHRLAMAMAAKKYRAEKINTNKHYRSAMASKAKKHREEIQGILQEVSEKNDEHVSTIGLLIKKQEDKLAKMLAGHSKDYKNLMEAHNTICVTMESLLKHVHVTNEAVKVQLDEVAKTEMDCDQNSSGKLKELSKKKSGKSDSKPEDELTDDTNESSSDDDSYEFSSDEDDWENFANHLIADYQ